MSLSPDDIPNTGNPYIEGARAFVRVVRLLNRLPFGDSRIQQQNRAAAREAGYTGTRAQLEAIGGGLRNRAAFELGQGGGPGTDRIAPGPPVRAAVPGFPGTGGTIPKIPGLPGGVSIPDRIPPTVVTGASRAATILSRVFGWGIGSIFFPTPTSEDSDLCVKTEYGIVCPTVVPAVPRPVPVPGTRPGRRSRPRVVTGRPTRPRVRPVASPVVPPQARPRGRPVTISQPRVIEQPRVISTRMPAPRSLPPPVANFPTPSTASVPATVPRAASVPVARVLSTVAAAAAAIPAVSSLFSSSSIAAPRIGSPTLPRIANPPALGTITFSPTAINPLTNPAAVTAPLTSFATRAAQSPAQELDRQCRERAERKRRKRKKRTTCYRGTYYESASGTRKYRKEKIPCQ